MKNSRRGDRSEGRGGDFKRRSFDRRGDSPRFGGRDDQGPRMHQATCADCGQSCEIPFRPTGDRPVYCSNCFGKHRNREEGRPEGRDERRPRWEEKRMFSATCDNCGKPCEVPFRPNQDKPVYCNDCFGKMGKGGPRQRPQEGSGQKDLSGQFKELNKKLDAILSVLSPKPVAVAKEKKIVVDAVKPKVKPAKPAKKKSGK